jgi:hypothetical protein
MAIGLRKLCTPAMVYLGISVFAILVMFMQNLGNREVYCVGKYQCHSTFSLPFIFLLKVIYVVFWTWILNIICASGYEGVAWFLVLIPFILFFISIAYIFLSSVPVDRYANPEYWVRKAL